jgi:hypothetical protein
VLQAIAELDADTADAITNELAVYIAGGGADNVIAFEDAVTELLSTDLTDDEIAILDKVETKLYEYYTTIQESNNSYIPSNMFDVDTIRSFIETSSASNFADDEELDVLLAKCYYLDPELFVDTVTGLSEFEISKVADKIIFGESKALNAIQSEGLSPSTYNRELSVQKQNLLGYLDSEIEEAELRFTTLQNSSFSTFAAAALPAPTIGTMSYSGTINVNVATTLSVVFSESTQTSSARTYYAQVINIRNGVEYVKAQKSFTIPSGSSSKTETFSITLSHAGTFYTKVKVYTAQNGTLLSQRTGTSPDISHGNWKITVALPTNRSNTGTLTIYNAGGESQFSCVCLGKSASGAAMNVTNGNTPIGPYTGYTAAAQSNTDAYGPNRVVIMNGATGNSYVPPRSGIWIHGGRSQTTLQPTNGCVRIFNAAQYTLTTDTIDVMTTTANGHNTTGNITITQS